MKVVVTTTKEVDARYIRVKAGVRYWEDGTINGTIDEDGTLTPFRNGDYWEPLIDIDKGIIRDWPKGTKAELHYKVCDDGEYWLLSVNMDVLFHREGYVPDILNQLENGYGDYIIMNIDEDGNIEEWGPSQDDIDNFCFTEE